MHASFQACMTGCSADLEGEGPGRQHERGGADGLPQQDAVGALGVRQHSSQRRLRPHQVPRSRPEERHSQHRVHRALHPRYLQQPPDVHHKILRAAPAVSSTLDPYGSFFWRLGPFSSFSILCHFKQAPHDLLPGDTGKNDRNASRGGSNTNAAT